MISSVNHNLEARRRDVRFGFHRGCCRAWVQVEYGSSISASSPAASKAPVSSSYSGTSLSAGAGGNKHGQEGGRYGSSERAESEGFDRRRKATTTTVEAMSGATRPVDEGLLERGCTAAASPSAV